MGSAGHRFDSGKHGGGRQREVAPLAACVLARPSPPLPVPPPAKSPAHGPDATTSSEVKLGVLGLWNIKSNHNRYSLNFLLSVTDFCVSPRAEILNVSLFERQRNGI